MSSSPFEKSPFEKPTQLGQLLQNIVRRKGLAEQSSGDALAMLWKQTAGERISSKSHVRRLRNGVLEIAVTNGAILEELNSYLHHKLLISLQAQHAEPKIENLKFVKSR